jgi:hypothetical protein
MATSQLKPVECTAAVNRSVPERPPQPLVTELRRVSMRGLCCRVRLGGVLAAFITLVGLSAGCGDTSGTDPLVFHVEGFNSDGLSQADAVGPTAAQVDVVQDLCGIAQLTAERFTQTEINAVFSNHEALDIHLEGFSVHVNDSRVGLGDFTGTLTGTIQGGRCSTQTDKTCAIDDDCVQAQQGTTGTTTATCTHQLTTVDGIVLFDFAAKAQVAGQPNVWGQALPVTITFFASDATQSFQTSGGYLVTFADFNNCSSTSTGA